MFVPSIRFLLMALLIGVWLMVSGPAQATELPPGVVNYVKAKDPNAKIRFDGLILFSNGESYLPVLPQDPTLNPDAQQVIMTVPENSPYPDLIQFDNHLFLLRLIQTASGRLTLPKMDEYPIQLKEGLLPQDFVLPNNLFIPVELKILLGALPYNPTFNSTPDKPLVPAQVLLQNPPLQAVKPMSAAYLFDLTNHSVVAADPRTGNRLQAISLDCVPAALKPSSDGKLLYAPCLTTDELVVLDVVSGLVKTRIPVGQRPDAVVVLPKQDEIVVSHRFSSHLSTVKASSLLAGEPVTLPGRGGAMAVVPETAQVVVANAAKPEVYRVDMAQMTVMKTIPTLPGVSALWVSPPTSDEGAPELWVASRSEHKVQVINLDTGAVLRTFDVGEKPLDFGVYQNQLLVVSAGQGRLDVIDWQSKELLPSIPLAPSSFPSGIAVIPTEHKAYVAAAGTEHLFVVNLKTGLMENAVPMAFRSGVVAASVNGAPVLASPTSPEKPVPLPTKTLQPPDNESVTLDGVMPLEPLADPAERTPTVLPPVTSVKSAAPAPAEKAEKKEGRGWFGRSASKKEGLPKEGAPEPMQDGLDPVEDRITR